MEQTATIVYLEHGVMLTKEPFTDWRAVQDAYYDEYKANLEPMTCTEIIEYFELEAAHSVKKAIFTREEITRFFESDDLILRKE